MKTKKRQKLCQNCEGDVDLDVIVCPFCAADLREEKPEQGGRSPYMPPQSRLLNSQHESPQPLYPERERRFTEPEEAEERAQLPLSTADQESFPWAPLLLLSLGVQLFLFGLFLLFFSSHGELVLRFDASLWYVYALVGLPILFWGYKVWEKLSDIHK